MRISDKRVVAGVLLALLAGCSEADMHTPEQAKADLAPEFPPSLKPLGDGYPAAGAPCRMLSHSEAVENWESETAQLVACPKETEANRLNGSVLGIVDGYFIVDITPAQAAADQDAGAEAEPAAAE